MKIFTTTGEFTLEEQLSELKVPELKQLAYGLGFKYKSGVKKQQILNHLCEVMLETPERFIRIAFSYELKAFLDIIEGQMSLKYAKQSEMLYALNRFNLIYATVDLDGESNPKLHFVEELGQRIKPMIPDELKRRESDGSLLMEKLALGCANLYGYTDMYYVCGYETEIARRLGHKLDDEFLIRSLAPVLSIMHADRPGEKLRPFLSPFAVMNGFYPDFNHVDPEIEPKAFDFDTILKYGEMPYPEFPLKECDSLRKMIDKYGRSSVDPKTKIRRLWIQKQDEQYASRLPDILRDFEFTNGSQINECMQMAVDFTNNVPYWRLRGHSSAEIGRKEIEKMLSEHRMPQITIGPNMRAMGIESFDQILSMAARGEDFPSAPASGRIGRNDPCPCGSGKKYKHCCGK